MEHRNITGADIFSLREKLGLNQTEFAERLNTDQSTVSKWERDEQRPNGFHAMEIQRLKEELSNGPRLTTHVLNTASGRPAAALTIALYRLEGDARTLLKSMVTNADGRCDEPLLTGEGFIPGQYELVFAAGDYFRAMGTEMPDPPFLDEVPIRFGMAEMTHYHVPLLISPYGYSTYRGS